MEPLIELPRDRWPELRDLFKEWWPHGVAGYSVVDTQYRKPALGRVTGFRLFCPWGDIHNGAVALNEKGTLKEVIILPTTNEVKKLEEACPPGTYVGPVKLEDIPQVDAMWPHRYPTSPEFFKLLINNDASYGLYSSEDNKLLTWVFFCESGFLTHLYSNVKQRGYAEFLMKHVSNKEASEGRYLWGHILEDNHASLNLFRKLEYEIIGSGVWIYVSSDSNAKLAH